MKLAPYWPRMMRRGTTAQYLDLTPTELDREVAAGRLPPPVKLGNHEHWSRSLLDEHLAAMTGEGTSHDWRKYQKAYAQGAS